MPPVKSKTPNDFRTIEIDIAFEVAVQLTQQTLKYMLCSLTDARLQDKKGFIAAYKGRSQGNKGEQILVLIEEKGNHTQVWVFSKTAGGNSETDWQTNQENVDCFELIFQQLISGIKDQYTRKKNEVDQSSRSFDTLSPYDILKVAPTASNEDILSAYRLAVKQYHPDQVSTMAEEIRVLAEERMKSINAAFRNIIQQRNDQGIN